MKASWARMWEVFHGALELEEPLRGRFIAEATTGDDQLRSKVEELLRSHSSASGFLERERAAAAGGGVEEAPERLGRYLIKEKIGEGGFADVYLALQTEPVRREVAVKVLRRTGSLARFEAEQQTLAELRHPNIAIVLDAGVDEQGRAYVVMEHIPGRPITSYGQESALGVGARLALFSQVCSAVQHAHHKGIIHRDLKPANVLVMDVDGSPQVKVIDFGIATVGGESRGVAGTPGYMSPEQAGAGDVDTRTDVFSLGVVLYELLAGVPPFEGGSGMTEWDRAAKTNDPELPSARAGPHAAGRLRGDLDWIVMKALARERQDRYASPAELSDDLTRYQQRRPVSAAPAGAAYRVGKFVRRNTVGVVAAAVVALLIVAGVVQLAVTARTEARLRGETTKANEQLAEKVKTEAGLRVDADKATSRARRSAKVLQTVNQFVTQDMLGAADPRKAPNPNVTMLEVVEAAEKKIGDRFKDEPEIEAEIRRTIGDTYRSLGKYDRALPHLEQAVFMFTLAVGEDDDRTQEAMNDLAILYRTLGRFGEAEPLYLKGITYRSGKFGPEHRETLSSMVNLGVLYGGVGRLSDAEKLLSSCLTTMKQALGPEDPDTVVTMQHLGVILQRQSRWVDAEPLVRETYELQKKLKGDEHPYTIAALNNIAINLENQGRLEESEAIKLRVIAAAAHRQGEEHIDVAVARASLGMLYIKMKRFPEAEALLKESVDRHLAVFGPDHPGTLQMSNNLGSVYDWWDKPAQAEEWFRKAADGARKTMQETNWSRGMYLLNHGRVLALKLGRAEEGLPRLEEALPILVKTLGAGHAQTKEAGVALADTYEKLGRGADADRVRAASK